MASLIERFRQRNGGLADLSDDDIAEFLHQKYADGTSLDEFKAFAGREEPAEQAGTFGSYVGIPLKQGLQDIKSAAGYAAEASGIAPETGREWQSEAQSEIARLESQKSPEARTHEPLITTDPVTGEYRYGGYDVGEFAQDVSRSAPAMLGIGVTGGLGATALGAGAVGTGIAMGAAEGLYSGAQNAAQEQQTIRNTPFDKLVDNPAFVEAYHNETDPEADQNTRLEQARDIMARRAGDEVFRKTAATTGAIGAVTGGGALGQMVTGANGGILARAAKGSAKEAGQETLQSAGEHYIQNVAEQKYLDPNIDPYRDVLTSAVEGGLVGGAMGLGGVFSPSRDAQPVDKPVHALSDAQAAEVITAAPTVDDAIAAAGAAMESAPVDDAIISRANNLVDLPELGTTPVQTTPVQSAPTEIVPNVADSIAPEPTAQSLEPTVQSIEPVQTAQSIEPVQSATLSSKRQQVADLVNAGMPVQDAWHEVNKVDLKSDIASGNGLNRYEDLNSGNGNSPNEISGRALNHFDKAASQTPLMAAQPTPLDLSTRAKGLASLNSMLVSTPAEASAFIKAHSAFTDTYKATPKNISAKLETAKSIMQTAPVQTAPVQANTWNSMSYNRSEVQTAPEPAEFSARATAPVPVQTAQSIEQISQKLPGYTKKLQDKLVVVPNTEAAKQYASGELSSTVQGFYSPKHDKVIIIADKATDKEATRMLLNHELLHRAEQVDPKVKATMVKVKGQFEKRFELAKLGKGTDIERRAYQRVKNSSSGEDMSLAEFRAYLVSEYNKDPNSLTGYIKKLVQDFIAAIRIGLMRAGVNLKELTAADMNRIAETYGAKAARMGEGEVTLFSNTAVDELWQELNAQPSTYLNDFKIKSKKGLGKTIETKDDLFYAALSQNQLVDLLEEILPEGRQFAKERNNYDVEESNWHNRADEIAKRWENIVEADRPVMRSEKNRQQLRLEQAKIADWMHESTTSGIDARLHRPKDTGKNGIELHKYDQLKAKWDNLSEDSRRLINDVDKFHQDVTARLLDALTDKVEHAEMPKETKAGIIKEIKSKFGKVQGPYFPLMRTGDYWIDHADGVEMFETEIEWKAAKKALKEKGTPVYGSGKSLKNFNRVEGVDANFLESVNDLIDTVADEDQANALKDGVFQLYLQALPENSMRKRMIHRKNTQGWEKDALRSFSRKAFHDGKQLAKLRFAPAMRRVLTDISNTVRYAESDKRYGMLKDRIQNIRDAIVLFEQGMDFDTIAAKFNDDTEALRPIRRFSRFKDEIDRDQAMTEYLKQQEALLEEVDRFRGLDFENKETRAANLLKALNKSYENMMKPSGNAASHFINQTVFTWMLGFNPGSALINLSQVPFVSAPVMAGRHTFQATNRAFWKAYRDFISGKEPSGDMGIYSKLDDNELKMYEALTENGLFDRTRAHDLAGFGDEGVARGTLWRDFMAASTYLFHKAEVMNREVTALMAFRLEYKKTGSLRQAIDYADKIVRDTHFDYAAANRPDLFQGNFRRVAFQFKMYSQGITYLWGKTFRDAFFTKLKTPEQKSEAKKIFYAMVGTQMIAAGAMGLPIGGILVGAQIAASALDDDDEPVDIEVEIRKALTYVFGDTIGKLIAKGPLSAATGLDFHSRLSLSDLWIREPDKDLEGKDTAYYLLKTAFGPAGGLLEDVFVGGKLWGEGNKERAIEKWLPHAVSSLVKSGRMIEEGGAAALSGEMIYEMNALEKAFQAAGIRSLGLSEQQEQNAAFKNRETAVGDAKLKLLHAAVNAKMKGDTEALKEAMDDIKVFNAKYPKLRITPASIMKSIKTRKKNKANTKEGLVVKPKYEFIRDEENFL